MKRIWIIATLAILLVCSLVRAQIAGLGETPVEITSDGESRFEHGLAIADDNVQIYFQDVSIYCDHAEYNPDTRDILLVGNVRIYSPDGLVTSQRALYNLQNKQMRGLNFSGSYYPMLFHALTVRTLSQEEFRIRNVNLTTDDSSQPDYHVKSKTMRIYNKDRVIFLNSTLYVGKVPIFWFPYLYSSLTKTGFYILPGYYAGWGVFFQSGYSFAWGKDNNNIATAHIDYRYLHGIALGLDSTLQLGQKTENQGLFRSYWANDTNPAKGINGPNPIDTPKNRYRVTYQQHLYVTDDIYATSDLNKLSDQNFMQDFYPVEFRTNPQPDNNISVIKRSENYTLNLLGRFQINNFQTTVERLPELAWDIKQHNIAGTWINYNGSTTIGQLEEAFGKLLLSKDPDHPGISISDPKNANKLQRTTPFPNYSAARFDTFHQISLPKTYFGWLSIIPRFGFRATAYNRSGSFFGLAPINPRTNLPISNPEMFGLTQTTISKSAARKAGFVNPKASKSDQLKQLQAAQHGINIKGPSSQKIVANQLNNPKVAQLPNSQLNNPQLASTQLDKGGAIFRPVVNFEIEASFKLSHAYERAQSRFLGLDGLMHIIQPYVDYSLVHNMGPKPRDIYQFDTIEPTTEPLPISFPDFQAIDAIDSWSILRTGIRNNLITRRNNANYQWVTLDTFFDYNFHNPYFPARVGNLNNYLTYYPSRWFTLSCNFQLPLDRDGFTEFATTFSFMPVRNFQFSISHTYLNGYPIANSFGFPDRIFGNTSQVTINAYYRLNDNWACSVQEQFDTTVNLLMYQRYLLHRDLSSWVASVGFDVRKNQGQPSALGVLVLMTLKAAPQVYIPMGIPAQGPMGPGGTGGSY